MDSNVPYIILGVHSTQAVEDCLNNGASAVVVDGNFLNKDDLKRFGTDRVYLKIKADNIENDPAYTKVVYEIDDASDAVDTVLALKKVNKQVEYIVLCTICSYDTLTKLHRHHIDVMTSGKTVVKDEKVLEIGQALVECLRTDREDKLFTTVVTDASGIALGLVYSNEDSVRQAVETQRGVYYSRSRKGLWKKGDTSGNDQILLRVDLDCDSDALRFMVIQRGDPPAFCHLNTLSCWGKTQGLLHLQETLVQRKNNAPKGSYTKRLFNDPTLLMHKLVEEAQELAEATHKDHIAAEAADLLYFAMVKCTAAGVTIPDIEAHLDKRSLKVSRRPGNAKQYRIDAANEMLNKDA